MNEAEFCHSIERSNIVCILRERSFKCDLCPLAVSESKQYIPMNRVNCGQLGIDMSGVFQ